MTLAPINMSAAVAQMASCALASAAGANSDIWRISRGLNKAEDMMSWLEARQLTLEDVEQFLETTILLSKAIFRMQDHQLPESS